MSYTETRVGRIKELPNTKNNVIELLKSLRPEINVIPEWVTSEFDYLDYFDLYDQYVIIDNRVFEILEDKSIDEDDLFELKQNEDGTLSFLLRYYNGGCGFDEALQIAYKYMK